MYCILQLYLALQSKINAELALNLMCIFLVSGFFMPEFSSLNVTMYGFPKEKDKHGYFRGFPLVCSADSWF